MMNTTMKPIAYVILLSLVLTILGSCSKRLEIPDFNQLEEDDFWNDESDALLGLAGVFDAYQVAELMGQKYREFDHLTDNATSSVGNTGWRNLERDSHLPSDNLVLSFWSAYYRVIGRANRVIEKAATIPTAGISEAARQRIVAEALFLRAYAYHDLTAIWGDVPFYRLLKNAYDVADGATAKADICDFMLGDLTNAIPHLPEQIVANERGRIARAAAQALLGKYHLTMENWGDAADAFGAIIASDRYALYEDYAKLFTPQAEYSEESVFELNFHAGSMDAGERFSVRVDTNLAPVIPSNHWTPIANLVNSYLARDGKPIANHGLYGAASPLYDRNHPFANRDPRLRAAIFTSADVTTSGRKIWNWNNNNSFAVKKYTSISSEQFINGGPQNYYVIRYADVLLSYAEARNEALAGPDDSVYEAINTVRRRVDMPDLPVGLSKDDMRQYIRDERRWEFALEHQRFFDLKRWGILGPVSAAAGSSKKYSEPRIFAWPYPQDELDRNASLQAQGQQDGY